MKAIAMLAVGLLGSMCSAQHEKFPDIPENHWALQALLNLKSAGYLSDLPSWFFRRPPYRTEMADVLVLAHRRLEQSVSDLEAERETLSDIELGRRSREFAKTYTDIAALSRMAEQFEHELKPYKVDANDVKQALAEQILRNADVRADKRISKTLIEVDDSSTLQQRLDLVPAIETLYQEIGFDIAETQARVQSLRYVKITPEDSGSDLTVDEAVQLLLSTPTYELLCFVDMPIDRRWPTSSNFTGSSLPGPVIECNERTTIKNLRRLSSLSTEKLRAVVAKLQEYHDQVSDGIEPAVLRQRFTGRDGEFIYWEAAIEMGRLAALLVRYVFEMPGGSMHPWTYDSKHALALKPKEFVGMNNWGNYGFPLKYYEYLDYPRRTHR